ncbi:MAG TPA: hypothetical protein VN132_07560 [Bdellovibrio sp.]|nr:hypothetical protein [Bdellovibrio sp.]
MSVTYSGDRWFTVVSDPWVLEVKGIPSTSQELMSDADILQSLVFDTAREIGLQPHSRIGGGHIHLDIETFFGEDKLLLRNFLVDLANHPELFLGALGFDLLNAPPIALLSATQREAFAEVIREFDEGKLGMVGIRKAIIRRVYNSTFYPQYAHQRSYSEKYQAVNLSHEKTIELRGLRPEKSLRHHLLILQLFEKRIEYLKRLDKPIAYNNKDYSNLFEGHTERALDTFTSHIKPEIIENAFRSYVLETELNWNDYRELLIHDGQEISGGGNSCEALFR